MAAATASRSQASHPATLPRSFSYATLAAEMAAKKRATSPSLASQGSKVAQGTACAIVHSHDISTCAWWQELHAHIFPESPKIAKANAGYGLQQAPWTVLQDANYLHSSERV